MDESSAACSAASAQGAHDSGGGGGAEALYVVNHAASLTECKVYDIFRCAVEVKGTVCKDESTHSLGMRAAFLECVRKELEFEYLPTDTCTDQFRGCSFENAIMGHCIIIKEHGGDFMVVYYTVPHDASPIGTLGYSFDASKFFNKLTAHNENVRLSLETARRSVSLRVNTDRELVDRMKMIVSPKACPGTPGLYQKGFKVKINVSDSGHPYSLVISTIAKKIAASFTALHSTHVGADLDDKDKKRKFVMFLYRLCQEACGGLEKLNVKLTHDGGNGIRSLDVVNARRLVNYVRYEAINLISESNSEFRSCIFAFVSDVDKSVYSVFRQSRECALFLTAGKALSVETDREIRAGRRRRKQAEDNDSDGEHRSSRKRRRKQAQDEWSDDESDGEDEDEVHFRTLEDIPKPMIRAPNAEDDSDNELDEDEDAKLFDPLLVQQLPDFFRKLSHEILSSANSRVLEMFNAGQCVQQAEAEQILLSAETVKVIYRAIKTVDERVVGYAFIPDFLDGLIPDRRSLVPFKKHLQVVLVRFPHCLWTPSDQQESGFSTLRDRFTCFADSLLSVGTVNMPLVSEQIAAAQKILDFLGETSQPSDVIVNAIRLINDGALQRYAQSKGKGKGKVATKSRQRVPRIDQGAGGAAPPDGVEAPESARPGRSQRISHASGSGDQGADGEPQANENVHARTRREIDVGNMITSEAGRRARRATERLPLFKNNDTMMRRPKEGFENPELLQLREAMKACASRQGGRQGVTGCVAELPNARFLGPDLKDLEVTDALQKIVVPFVPCKVESFENLYPDEFPGIDFAYITYENSYAYETFVDVRLLLRTQTDMSIRKQVGVRLFEGITYVHSVSVARQRRSGDKSASTDQAGLANLQGGAVLSFVSSDPTAEVRNPQHPEHRRGGRVQTGAASGPSSASASRSATLRGGSVEIAVNVDRVGRRGSANPGLDKCLEWIENPLECGKIISAKLSASDDCLICVDPETLFREYHGTVELSRAARRGRALGAGASYRDGLDESVITEDGDADYVPHKRVALPGEVQPLQQDQPLHSIVTHANSPFTSFNEFRQAVKGKQYEMLNPVAKFCAVFNPDYRGSGSVVLLSPCDGLPKSGVDCVYEFLLGIPIDMRVIHGPFYLQFPVQQISGMDAYATRLLFGMSVSEIRGNIFQPEHFLVLKTETREDGRRYLNGQSTDLITYLSDLIPGFSNDALFKTLFQLCPDSPNMGDPLSHSNAQCCFRSDESDIFGTGGSTRLDDLLRRHQRAPPCVTAASACYIPAPGCKWLFRDFTNRECCFCLLGKDDQGLTQGGDATQGVYVYAVEMHDEKMFGRVIKSTYYTRGHEAALVQAANDKDSSDSSD